MWLSSVEAERRQRIIAEVIPLHETIESNSVRLSAVLTSRRPHPNQHLPPSSSEEAIKSSRDVMRQILDKSAGIVSRATHGDVTASDVSVLLELASQSHRIIDSATVHVGQSVCLSLCLSVCLLFLYSSHASVGFLFFSNFHTFSFFSLTASATSSFHHHVSLCLHDLLTIHEWTVQHPSLYFSSVVSVDLHQRADR